MTYTTQKQVRAAFWREHPYHDRQARAEGKRSLRQNDQTAIIRHDFAEFVGQLATAGVISAALAWRVTL